MALQNALGELALDKTLVNRYGGGKLSYVATVTTAGNNTLITPANGKRLEIYWVYAITRPDLDPPLMTFSVGAQNLYRVYALSHWELFTGLVNEPLILNLGAASNVAVTVHYKEVT